MQDKTGKSLGALAPLVSLFSIYQMLFGTKYVGSTSDSIVTQSLTAFHFALKSGSLAIVKSVSKPSKTMLERLRYHEIPKRLLILNSLVTGIYTVSVLAASYSATLVAAEHRLAVVASSGMINGVASILLTLLIDPKSAMITDQASPITGHFRFPCF